MEFKEFKMDINGTPLIIRHSLLAKQTNGAVLAKLGDTEVLSIAVMGNEDKFDKDCMPLTVDYEEKYYASGKLFGSRFVRRESRPTENAVLISRMIDRTVRPLFNPYLRREVQVNTTCLAFDEINDPDIVSMIASSLSLMISDIPWNGPIGAVRVGYKEEVGFIVNPNYKQREEGLLFEMTLSGIKDKINMIEFQGSEVMEDLITSAFELGQKIINDVCDFQEKIAEEIGIEKTDLNFIVIDEEFKKRVYEMMKEKQESILFSNTLSKLEKQNEMTLLIISTKQQLVEEEFSEEKINTLTLIIEELTNDILHEQILKNDKRPDGRKLTEIRPLDVAIDIIGHNHGNALFVRGDTQTLSVVTLGSPLETLTMQGMEIVGEKRYMHHYNFPQWSVGEIGRSRGPGRREIGHGALAEKAILPMIPEKKDFPYTIRVVSEVLSSNGSSSMASTCSSCLSLMVAGVPIKEMVAGIAMGVIIDQNDEAKYKILTDIQGPEDHYGDMDFKVAGTKNGVNALQLDVKVNGIDKTLLEKALVQAKEARLFILEKMKNVISEPRKEISIYAPKILSFEVNPDKIGEIIGGGGKTINKIIEMTETKIDIEDKTVYVMGMDMEKVNKAKTIIENLIREYQEGDIVEGIVDEIKDFGAIVYFDGNHSGLLHISEIDNRRINKVTDILKVGDKLQLKIIKVENGKISLSLKALKK